MNPSQKAIEAKAEELYPEAFGDITNDVYSFNQINAKNFIKGATFGLSLQTNEWVSVSDRLPTKEDADEKECVECWDIEDLKTRTIHITQLSKLAAIRFPYWRRIVKPVTPAK